VETTLVISREKRDKPLKMGDNFTSTASGATRGAHSVFKHEYKDFILGYTPSLVLEDKLKPKLVYVGI